MIFNVQNHFISSIHFILSCSHSTKKKSSKYFLLPTIFLYTGDTKMNITLIAPVLMEMGAWEGSYMKECSKCRTT